METIPHTNQVTNLLSCIRVILLLYKKIMAALIHNSQPLSWNFIPGTFRVCRETVLVHWKEDAGDVHLYDVFSMTHILYDVIAPFIKRRVRFNELVRSLKEVYYSCGKMFINKTCMTLLWICAYRNFLVYKIYHFLQTRKNCYRI